MIPSAKIIIFRETRKELNKISVQRRTLISNDYETKVQI